MKIFFILIIAFLFEIKSNFLRNLDSQPEPPAGDPPSGNPPSGDPPGNGGKGDGPGGSSTNTYDYTNYMAESTNENLSKVTLESTTADQSVVYITDKSKTISGSTLKKTSGDSSNTEISEFYGVNAANLVQSGEVTITGGTITTNAKGANALCATNNGKVIITGTKIESTGQSSARGLHATYGGSITANDVTISSTGGSCVP